MTQTTNRFFDEVARLMNDAAGVAQGVRREFDTLFQTQAETLAARPRPGQARGVRGGQGHGPPAREENEALKARIAALEAQARPAATGSLAASPAPPPTMPGSECRACALQPDDSRVRYSLFSFAALAAISPRSPRPRHPWRHAAAISSSNSDEDL